MPQAQRHTGLACIALGILCSVVMQRVNADVPATVDLSDHSDLDALLSVALPDETIESLRQMMDRHVARFIAELDMLDTVMAPSYRSKRATMRIPSVDGVSRLPSNYFQMPPQLQNSTDIDCFSWNGDRFCILGGSIFTLRAGGVTFFPDVLPVRRGDTAKAHVYDGVVFVAISNKNSSHLRLHLLREPDWVNTSMDFQLIKGERLEDIVFFEDDGDFYMALAIQLGTKEYAKDVGMQCAIYKWSGTTMDMVKAIPMPDLRKVEVLQSDGAAHLVLLSGNANVQLWRFSTNAADVAQLIDVVEVGLSYIHQVDAFITGSRWFLLFGGVDTSLVYTLKDQMLLRWQMIKHKPAAYPDMAWMRVQQDEVESEYDSVILIFNALLSQYEFEFYISDPSGYFTRSFVSSSFQLRGIPSSSVVFLDGPGSAHLYLTTTSKSGSALPPLEGFTVQISEALRNVPEPDPLLKCLSDVETLIENFNDRSTIKQAEELKNNMVHVKDNLRVNGTVIVTEVSYKQPPTLGSVKVLYNFTDTFERPAELNNTINALELLAANISQEIPELLYVNSSKFTGNLTLTGDVEADRVDLASIAPEEFSLNGHNWNDFLKQVWRYSGKQTIDHDITIGNVTADNVHVGYTIGMSNPSHWLLRSGGKLHGRTTFNILEVLGDLQVDGLINGISMEDVVNSSTSRSAITGAKRFARIHVVNNVTVDTVNDRSFRAWADELILQNDPNEQHFTGTVRMIGPVHVGDGFRCDLINNINVTQLSEIFVNKSADNTVEGSVRFTKGLVIVDASVDTLNGVLVEDLLSTSGNQVIRAALKIDTVDLLSDLECRDINGIDFGDFLYTDEDQTVQGPVEFSSNLSVNHLLMENGTLNGMDVIGLLNPPSLRIDSAVTVKGDWVAGSVNVRTVNGVNLTNIRESYWTKSTDQKIDADVRMPFGVTVEGNVTTGTFLGRPINSQSFYFTSADETINSDVVFLNDVMVAGNLTTLDELPVINNISIRALDEDVVKKSGEFQLVGTTTFEQLTINGNLNLEDTFNDLVIPDDIVLLDRPQTLSNFKFDSDITGINDVTFTEGNVVVMRVANISLDAFVEQAVLNDEDAVIDGDVVFRDLDVSELIVLNTLNGRNVTNLVNNGIRRSGQGSLKLSELTVHGEVTFKDTLNGSSFNEYDLKDYFGQVVNMTEPEIFLTGVKRLTNPVKVNGDATFDSFNGIPLEFSTVLTATGNQTITGNYFFRNLTARSIDLRAINGRNLSDYVQTSGTNETQVIAGELAMDHVSIHGPLRIESRILNGCNLTHFHSIENFTRFDSLSIASGSSLLLEEPWENNRDLASLVLESLRKDRPQEVSGPVTINSNVATEHMSIPSNRIGDTDLHELFNGSMLKSVEQNVTGDVNYPSGSIVIRDLGHVGHLNVVKWNGQDVKKMVDQVVMKDESQTVSGMKTFIGNFSVRGNLDVAASIDGVPVQALVSANDSRLPTGTQFTSLIIEKELNVTSGMINGVNLTAVLSSRVPLIGNCTIKSDITFEDTVIADSIKLNSGVNNLNISDLLLKTAAPGQVVTGQKIFKQPLNIEGNVTVSELNGRTPEDFSAFLVLKDQDAQFDKSVTFGGGLSVMKAIDTVNYGEEDMNKLMTAANLSSAVSQPKSVLSSPAHSLLMMLQSSSARLADFEYFEQIQQIPSKFNRGSHMSMHVHFCPLPTRWMGNNSQTATGILVTRHSADGNSCGLKKPCRCHRSISLPTDASGHANTLPMSIRLKDYLKDKQMYGDRVHLLRSRDQLFAISISSLPGCESESVSIVVVDPLTFRVLTQTVLEFQDTIVDVALKHHKDGRVFLTIGQTVSGLFIISFDGLFFNFHQLVEVEAVAAIDMVATDDSLFLAVASYGLDAMSSIWWLNNSTDKFEAIKYIATVGSTDVLFTKSNKDLYVTFSQDPPGIDPYSESWTQFKVPPQVLFYSRSSNTFDIFQQLDIDRVISLTNLEIEGAAYVAAATIKGRVRIYRVVHGQGFIAEQTFKSPGIRSIAGYSIRNETFLAAVAESRTLIFVARLRGFVKPSMKL